MNNYDAYIEKLYLAQNIGAEELQKNLCPREFYEQLVLKVLNIMKKHKDASIEELRKIIYDQSKVEQSIRHFILERKMAPGAVITYGTKNYQETIILGNKEEVILQDGKLIESPKQMEEDTIFDLASVTKGFTAIATLKLVEMGLIDNLQDDITKYAPQFKNLKGITIYDLLTFTPLKTNERIDNTTNKEDAEKILFTASRNNIPENSNPYNDISPMVLKFIIEKTSGMDYYSFLKCTFLDSLNMKDTHVKIPEEKIDRVASGNYDTRYYKDGKLITRDYITKGISTDDKARILGQPEGILSGHAGLFSTASNMETLARALIENKIFNFDIRREMTKNRTGKMYLKEDGSKGFIQFLGMLHYSKNPILEASEVHHPLSGESFASAGWSGTQLTIDPLNEINFFMGANRSHNRLTILDPIHKDKLKKDKYEQKTIILPDGREIIDASSFAFDKPDSKGRDGAIVHPCLELALQYKILEDIIGQNNLTEKKKIYIKK